MGHTARHRWRSVAWAGGLGEAFGVAAGMIARRPRQPRVPTVAAHADVPLLGWVAFATLLQGEVGRRNESR